MKISEMNHPVPMKNPRYNEKGCEEEDWHEKLMDG